MRNNHTWMTAHVLVVMTHIGMSAMLLTALITIFVDRSTALFPDTPTYSINRHLASISSIHVVESLQYPVQHAMHITPPKMHQYRHKMTSLTAECVILMAAHAVTVFGAVSNIGFSIFIHRLGNASVDYNITTVQMHFAKQRLAFTVLAILNLCLALTDFVLAGILSRYAPIDRVIVAPITMASVAGLSTALVLLIDAREYWAIHRQFRDVMKPNVESGTLMDDYED